MAHRHTNTPPFLIKCTVKTSWKPKLRSEPKSRHAVRFYSNMVTWCKQANKMYTSAHAMSLSTVWYHLVVWLWSKSWACCSWLHSRWQSTLCLWQKCHSSVHTCSRYLKRNRKWLCLKILWRDQCYLYTNSGTQSNRRDLHFSCFLKE